MTHWLPCCISARYCVSVKYVTLCKIETALRNHPQHSPTSNMDPKPEYDYSKDIVFKTEPFQLTLISKADDGTESSKGPVEVIAAVLQKDRATATAILERQSDGTLKCLRTFGMPAQRDLITPWRAAVAVSRCKEIRKENLTALYYGLHREVDISFIHLQEEAQKILGEVEYDRLMATTPPEELIQIILKSQLGDRPLASHFLTLEVDAGTLSWRPDFGLHGIETLEELDEIQAEQHRNFETINRLSATIASCLDFFKVSSKPYLRRLLIRQVIALSRNPIGKDIAGHVLVAFAFAQVFNMNSKEKDPAFIEALAECMTEEPFGKFVSDNPLEVIETLEMQGIGFAAIWLKNEYPAADKNVQPSIISRFGKWRKSKWNSAFAKGAVKYGVEEDGVNTKFRDIKHAADTLIAVKHWNSLENCFNIDELITKNKAREQRMMAQG